MDTVVSGSFQAKGVPYERMEKHSIRTELQSECRYIHLALLSIRLFLDWHFVSLAKGDDFMCCHRHMVEVMSTKWVVQLNLIHVCTSVFC